MKHNLSPHVVLIRTCFGDRLKFHALIQALMAQSIWQQLEDGSVVPSLLPRPSVFVFLTCHWWLQTTEWMSMTLVATGRIAQWVVHVQIRQMQYL